MGASKTSDLSGKLTDLFVLASALYFKCVERGDTDRPAMPRVVLHEAAATLIHLNDAPSPHRSEHDDTIFVGLVDLLCGLRDVRESIVVKENRRLIAKLDDQIVRIEEAVILAQRTASE